MSPEVLLFLNPDKVLNCFKFLIINLIKIIISHQTKVTEYIYSSTHVNYWYFEYFFILYPTVAVTLQTFA